MAHVVVVERSARVVALQKFAGYVDCLIQQTARIIPQIKNQLAHALLLQVSNIVAQFIVGGMLETADESDVTRTDRDHERVANRREGDCVATDLDSEQDLFAGAFNFQFDLFPTIAAHVFGNFITVPIKRVLPIDFENAISVTQASAICGRAVDDRLNVDAVIVPQNLYADAVEARRLVLLQFLEFGYGKINRVRVERGEHPLNRSLRSLFVIDLADIPFFNRRNGLAVIGFNSVGLVLLSGWLTRSCGRGVTPKRA